MKMIQTAAASRSAGWCRKPLRMAILGLLLGAGQAMAAHEGPLVEPLLYGADGIVTQPLGNPSCTQAGFVFGFKVDVGAPDVFGTWSIYYLGDPTGDLETRNKEVPEGATLVGSVEVFETSGCETGDGQGRSGGSCIGFESTVAVGGVIVKGGPNANVYDYRSLDEQVRHDTNLTNPLQTSSNNFPGTSHVNFCFDEFPTVAAAKTAVTTFDREYEWDVEKTVDFDEEARSLDYDIIVSSTEFADTYTVSGTISVTNISGLPLSIDAVTDAFEGALGPVDVDCGDLPATLDVLQALTCSYSGVSDGTDATNVATVEYTAFDGAGIAKPEAAFAFGAPNEINACVDVWDLLSIDVTGDLELALLIDSLIPGPGEEREAGPTVCLDELIDGAISFSYTIDAFPDVDEDGTLVGSTPWDQVAPGQCIDIEISNEAVVVAVGQLPEALLGLAGEVLPEPELASDMAVVVIEIRNCPEVGGCTRTRGYWQTHSIFGPAPYDETWAEIGETTPFFGSDLSWIEAIRTPPRGDAYFQLAPQFIAATLNGFAGASLDAIADELAAAEALFARCNPGDFAQGRGNGRNAVPAGSCAGDEAEARRLASILDAYNNGLAEGGPPKCVSARIE